MYYHGVVAGSPAGVLLVFLIAAKQWPICSDCSIASRNLYQLVAEGVEDKINIPVDVVILPKSANDGDFPLLIEAKSAGDFTNVNKRRKEEAAKMQQLKNTYGNAVSYSLFLCGYFDSGYLGYEAAEGIDWIWEHRINDLEQLGI